MDGNEKKETHEPEPSNNKETKQEEKIANKHISDLEVYNGEISLSSKSTM